MMKAFNRNQVQMISAVAVIEVLRMFGTFLVMPVFTLYGQNFTSNTIMIGVAFGAYGLTMAIFQAPLGKLSDRIGRKQVIILGMIPYIVGNLIAWHPFSIWGLIIGRLIAGAGAVTSSGMAMVQENVPDERRNLAMAILGIPIGLAFMAGIMVGPFFAGLFGLPSIFLISAILGVVGILPMINVKYRKPHVEPGERKYIGRMQPKAAMVGVVGLLMSIYMIIFFYYLPLYGTAVYGSSGYDLLLFLPMLIGGFIAVAMSGIADRGYSTLFAIISLVVMLASIPLVFVVPHTTSDNEWFLIGTTVFFTGFSIYEIVYTPIIARISRKGSYGANIGMYNSFQFSGQFIGGIMGGSLVTLKLSGTNTSEIAMILLVIGVLAMVFLYLATKFREVKRQDQGTASSPGR